LDDERLKTLFAVSDMQIQKFIVDTIVGCSIKCTEFLRILWIQKVGKIHEFYEF